MHLYAFIVRYFERMDESFNGLDCESPKFLSREVGLSWKYCQLFKLETGSRKLDGAKFT